MQASHFVGGIYGMLIHKYISEIAFENYRKSNFKYENRKMAEDVHFSWRKCRSKIMKQIKISFHSP